MLFSFGKKNTPLSVGLYFNVLQGLRVLHGDGLGLQVLFNAFSPETTQQYSMITGRTKDYDGGYVEAIIL